MKHVKFQWSYLIPLTALIVMIFSFLNAQASTWFNALTTLFLVAAVMSAVHHAEVVAHKVGESLGTLILAISVTIIEVGLIVLLMSAGGADAAVVARDTVFAAVMIVSNGIVGLSLILGGLRHKEQNFSLQGASSILIMLIVLSALTLVLPTFTVSTSGATYNPIQLLFASVASLILYVLFIVFQTRTHKNHFESENSADNSLLQDVHEPSKKEAWLSFVSLIISLVAVIGLAKFLAPTIENFIISVGAPRSVTGALIALIVLLPETWAAVSAARMNRLQTSLNLALGSGVASIALTIPVVSLFALLSDKILILGLDAKGLVFLILTFMVGGLTLGTGRTTALNGAVHLVILLAYFVLSFVP